MDKFTSRFASLTEDEKNAIILLLKVDKSEEKTYLENDYFLPEEEFDAIRSMN